MFEPPSAVDGPTITSTSLILRIQAGESVAWERFKRLYGPLIYSWCRMVSLQPADAEDVGQEVMHTLLRKVGDYQRTGSFRSWLWKVTYSKIKDHGRRGRRRPQAIGGSDFYRQIDALPEDPPDSEVGEERSRALLLLRALELIRDEFEPSTWTAFWRMTVDGDSATEIARDLGWSDGTSGNPKKAAGRVRQAKLRVVQRLKAEFGEVLDLPKAWKATDSAS